MSGKSLVSLKRNYPFNLLVYLDTNIKIWKLSLASIPKLVVFNTLDIKILIVIYFTFALHTVVFLILEL